MSIQHLKAAIQALTFQDVKALAERGISVIAIARLDDACTAVQAPTVYKVVGWQGSKIEAIKELRSATGIGLAEAKYTIDTAIGEVCPAQYAYYFTENPNLQFVVVKAVQEHAAGLVRL